MVARLSIKPDLVLERSGGVAAVADTKYKLLDENGKIPNADAYQLVTYCARLGLVEGHLIYAGDNRASYSFTVIGTGLRLHVHAVDLRAAVEVIETQVRDIGEAIATLAGTNARAS